MNEQHNSMNAIPKIKSFLILLAEVALAMLMAWLLKKLASRWPGRRPNGRVIDI